MPEEKRSGILGDTYIKTKDGEIVIRSGLKLAIAWIVFVLLCSIYIYIFYIHKTDDALPGMNNTVKMEIPKDANYRLCDIDEINELIVNYLNARVACNQALLQSLVTDPTEFNNMDSVERVALYLRGFNNTTCYIADGYEEGSYLVIELSNINIANVESEPLDIISFYVITDTDGSYKINNGELTAEQQAFVENLKASQDIQDIYIHVKENVDYLLSTDESFVEFYDLIN